MRTGTFILQVLDISPSIWFMKIHEEEREKNRYAQEDTNLMGILWPYWNDVRKWYWESTHLLLRRSDVREKTLNCYRDDAALEKTSENVIEKALICYWDEVMYGKRL